MMTNEAKKELFLQIIENWFLDVTDQINFSNCIGFYHFFLNSLEFEIKYTLELEKDFHLFLDIILKKISELIYESPNLDVTKNCIILTYPNIHPEQLELFWGDLLSIYSMAKDEYFL